MSNERVCGTLIRVTPIANQPLSMIYNNGNRHHGRARSAHTPTKFSPTNHRFDQQENHRSRQPSSSERLLPNMYFFVQQHKNETPQQKNPETKTNKHIDYFNKLQ